MKKLLIVLLIVLGFTSCSKLVGELVSKLMSMQTVDANFTLPIIADTSSFQNYGPTSSDINIDSFITSYSSGNYTIKNLKRATLQSCVINITNPDSENNFANVQSCEIDFSSDANPTVVHPAAINNNPDVYADSLSVPVDNSVDLTNYMNAKHLYYTIKARLRRPTTKVLNCTIHIKLDIEMK